MGSSSVCTHRGLAHWQGLLLVVSLLNFWSQPTTAQITIEIKEALEGEDVTLRIHHKAHDVAYIVWYRGTVLESDQSIAFLAVNLRKNTNFSSSGQVSIKNDGSLLLKNVTTKDSGFYTVLVQLHGCQRMIACGKLDVYAPVSVPTLLASNTTVTENKGAVVFTCKTNEDAIQWLFNNRTLTVSRLYMKLSHDYRNLIIQPVLRLDAGDYQCEVSNPRSSRRSAPIKLDVKFE